MISRRPSIYIFIIAIPTYMPHYSTRPGSAFIAASCCVYVFPIFNRLHFPLTSLDLLRLKCRALNSHSISFFIFVFQGSFFKVFSACWVAWGVLSASCQSKSIKNCFTLGSFSIYTCSTSRCHPAPFEVVAGYHCGHCFAFFFLYLLRPTVQATAIIVSLGCT